MMGFFSGLFAGEGNNNPNQQVVVQPGAQQQQEANTQSVEASKKAQEDEKKNTQEISNTKKTKQVTKEEFEKYSKSLDQWKSWLYFHKSKEMIDVLDKNEQKTQHTIVTLTGDDGKEKIVPVGPKMMALPLGLLASLFAGGYYMQSGSTAAAHEAAAAA